MKPKTGLAGSAQLHRVRENRPSPSAAPGLPAKPGVVRRETISQSPGEHPSDPGAAAVQGGRGVAGVCGVKAGLPEELQGPSGAPGLREGEVPPTHPATHPPPPGPAPGPGASQIPALPNPELQSRQTAGAVEPARPPGDAGAAAKLGGPRRGCSERAPEVAPPLAPSPDPCAFGSPAPNCIVLQDPDQVATPPHPPHPRQLCDGTTRGPAPIRSPHFSAAPARCASPGASLLPAPCSACSCCWGTAMQTSGVVERGCPGFQMRFLRGHLQEAVRTVAGCCCHRSPHSSPACAHCTRCA